MNEKGEVEVEGCLRRGVDRKTALSIFSEMESFASYAFNKSHAAAYAAVSYQTAYLKCHYKREYMAALLSSVIDSRNKTAVYISECHRMGVAVLPPSVNESESKFTVSGSNIRFGLSAIKNLGLGFIAEIIRERRDKPYASYYDFCKRVGGKGLNIRSLESLIKCGALDHLGANRRQMLSVMKTVLDDLDYDRRKGAAGQISLFDMGYEAERSAGFVIPPMQEFPLAELLSQEKEMAGMYLSGHPIDAYAAFAAAIGADSISELMDTDSGSYQDRARVRLVATVTRNRSQITKSDKMMAFVEAEDRYGSCEIIVFPNVLERCASALYVGAVIEVEGTLSMKEEEEPKVIAEKITALPPADQLTLPARGAELAPPVPSRQDVPTPQHPSRLYLKVPSLDSREYRKAKNLLEIFRGSTKVIFYLSESNTQMLAPASLWANLNDTMLEELRYQLGDGNVRLK